MNALDLGPRPLYAVTLFPDVPLPLSALRVLTFSYGRALQQSCLKAWQGKNENWAKAQQEFL